MSKSDTVEELFKLLDQVSPDQMVYFTEAELELLLEALECLHSRESLKALRGEEA
jgi:hypothetical protein